MSVRKFFFWFHLVCGVIAGSIILIMSVTGVLLAYERQMLAWADRSSYHVEPPARDAQPLPVEEAIRRAVTATRDTPTAITLRSKAGEPIEMAIGRERSIFVNPYTGAVLGEGSARAHAFFAELRAWHRWLGAAGSGRSWGRGVTGFCNLLFLFLVSTGLYLWFPRRLSWQHVKPITAYRSGLKGKARDWNWHNVTGFWCAIPLLAIVASAVVMSYPWANNLVYQLAGTPIPKQGQGPGGPGGPGERGSGSRALDPNALNGISAMIHAAASISPDWTSISFQLPRSAKRPVPFTVDSGTGGQPNLRLQATVDRDGKLLRTERFADNPTGRRWRMWLRFVHTGEAGGIIGQAIAMVATAGGALLVWTGLALAWRRLRSWQRRRQEIGGTKAAVEAALN